MSRTLLVLRRFRWECAGIGSVTWAGWYLAGMYGWKALYVTIPGSLLLGHLGARADIANYERERP